MKIEDLNKIKKQIEDDLQITDQNVLSKSLTVPNLFQKILSIFVRESLILKKMKADLDKEYGLKIKFYKETYDHKLNVAETSGYIDSDEVYFKKKNEFLVQESICSYLEESMGNIKQLSFQIKNYIELKKFLLGG